MDEVTIEDLKDMRHDDDRGERDPVLGFDNGINLDEVIDEVNQTAKDLGPEMKSKIYAEVLFAQANDDYNIPE